MEGKNMHGRKAPTKGGKESVNRRKSGQGAREN
jgi:hypothetical protein